jgi:hypothetical protein
MSIFNFTGNRGHDAVLAFQKWANKKGYKVYFSAYQYTTSRRSDHRTLTFTGMDGKKYIVVRESKKNGTVLIKKYRLDLDELIKQYGGN